MATSRPIITVAICVYNTPKTLLDNCLESVFAQDFQSFSVLIVDNNSSNTETHEVISKYKQKYKEKCKLVLKKENKGLHDSRNVAIANCDGDYIAFVDSDDIVSKDYLSLLYNNINHDSGLIISKIGFKRFDSTCSFDNIKGQTATYNRNEAILMLLTERLMPSVWGTLFPVGCFVDFVCSEKSGVDDMQMNLHSFDNCQGVVFNSITAYGWRNANNSSMKNNKFLHMVDFSLDKWLDYSEKKCPDATPYLKFRIAISRVKCAIVDYYGDYKKKDFFHLIAPLFKEVKMSLRKYKKALYLSRKKIITYRLMCTFKRLYCRLYYAHRNKGYNSN